MTVVGICVGNMVLIWMNIIVCAKSRGIAACSVGDMRMISLPGVTPQRGDPQIRWWLITVMKQGMSGDCSVRDAMMGWENSVMTPRCSERVLCISKRVPGVGAEKYPGYR
tara:strand:+ start:120 stop:449 length:330 start_codon:yes stop_codon:yes gene_type:complete